MKTFLKILSISLLLAQWPTTASACGYYPLGEELRVACFGSNTVRFNELIPFSLNFDVSIGSLEYERYNWSHNLAEWYAYCQGKVPTVYIYNALYGSKRENIAQNPFIMYLKKHKKNAYAYLEILLKFSENKIYANNDSLKEFHQIWDDFSTGNYYGHTQENTPNREFLGERLNAHILAEKDPFLRKRWAYQGIVSAFYSEDTVAVKTLFSQFFVRNNGTWMDNSAKHYLALVSPDRNRLLLECVSKGYDKLARNIQLLRYSDNFNEAFAQKLDPNLQSYYYAVKGIGEFGRGLSHLQKIMALNPKNQYINFLINREINKIETWLLPHQILHKSFQEIDNWQEPKPDTYQADLAYARQFYAFLEKINGNDVFRDLARAYLGNILGVKNVNFSAEKYKSDKAQYVQARVVDFIINLEKKIADNSYKSDILYIFSQINVIDKEKEFHSIWWTEDFDMKHQNTYMRQQLARNLGQYMVKFPKTRTEGLLLGFKSCLPQDNIEPFFGTFAYVYLYHSASPEDCLAIAEILDKKTGKDTYLKFLQNDEIDHYKLHYCSEYPTAPKGQYDRIKVLDIAAQKFASEGKFEQAIAIYRRFPKAYWKDAYMEMPFVVNIYRAHNPVNVHFKTQYFNKLTFLEQLVDYERQLKKRPNDPLLHYYLANGYFSLTPMGCLWYAARPYTSNSDLEEAMTSDFTKKSMAHFRKTIELSKDNVLKSACLLALSVYDKGSIANLSKENKILQEKITTNCDLYINYLHNLTKSYKSTTNHDEARVLLQGFQRFSVINDYYY